MDGEKSICQSWESQTFEISKASSNKLERKPTEYNIKKPNGKVFLEVGMVNYGLRC